MRSTWQLVRLLGLLAQASVQLIVTRPSTRPDRALWLHRLCRRATGMFGVEVKTFGSFPDRGVLISNHLSYLDIVVFASICPCVFVSKAEIASWPLLGWMTTVAGTVYVQRGRGSSAAREAGQGMRGAANAGLPVVLFPEGTTSNGETILKFHSGLLAEALAAEQPITPAFLRYSLTATNRPPATVRDNVAFWGDHPMLPHIFRFLSLRGIRAEVWFGSAPIPLVAGGPTRRKAVAIEARQAVCALGDVCTAADPD